MKDHGVIEAKEAPGYASLEIKRLQHNLPFPFSDFAPASEGTTLQSSSCFQGSASKFVCPLNAVT